MLNEPRPALRTLPLGTLLNGALVVGCVVMFVAFVLWTLAGRVDVIDSERTTESNLAYSLAEQASGSMDTVAVVLEGIAERDAFGDPAFLGGLRSQQLLLDRIAEAPQIHSIDVLGRDGRLQLSSLAADRRAGGSGDSAAFRFHRNHPGTALRFDAPTVIADGTLALPVSRRIDDRAGHFDGVAVAMLSLARFGALYERVDVGKSGLVTLARDDGTILVRWSLVKAIANCLPNRRAASTNRAPSSMG